MNFLGWCTNRDRELKKYHVFMVSGEKELANIVVQEILDYFRGDLREFTGAAKWKDVDASINQPRFRQQVIVLRDVDKFDYRENLISWIEETGELRDRRVILVLTASVARPDKEKGTERWIPNSKHVAYVDCAAVNEERLHDFVLGYLPTATDSAAEKLISLCRGDITILLREMAVLRRFPSVDEKLVEAVVYPAQDDDVVSALFEGRTADILALDPSTVNMRRVIAGASDRLRHYLNLLTLREGKRIPYYELIKRTDVPQWMLKKRLDELRSISPEQVWRRLELLREVDVRLCGGVEIGLLHYLAIKWP